MRPAMRPIREPRHSRRLERSTQIQIRLINDLLDFSRIGRGKIELERAPVDLAALLESSVESLHESASVKGLALDTRTMPAWVLGDVARLAADCGQPAHQRHPVHAGGRLDHRFAPERRAERRDSGQGHRRGDRAGVPAACLRSIPAGRDGLPPPARRPRPRAGHRSPARRAARRHGRGGERGGRSGRRVQRDPSGAASTAHSSGRTRHRGAGARRRSRARRRR